MSHAQTPHLSIPSRVGNYSLLKTIGKGQFGYVKLAIHDLTRERVAIKVIQKNRLDEKTLKMVSREISIMKLLNHPNVIRLYEVIDSDIFLFLVMEYAAGGEIMDFIVTHGKLKERDARRIFRQVVEAIDYCHEVHVIHRDLKAENLLLDSQLGIKLIDFGLSNRWAPGELLKTFCGSPTYTAPELIKRQQYEGPEVDLWSLGVLLYVLVCGSLPFDGNTFQELFTKIINGQYTVPEHVSLECRDLIGRMLVVNPKQRATLDQVREHPWTRESGKPVPKAHVMKMAVPLNEQDMDQDVLEELINIGFERDSAIQAVLSNSYDDAAATYYLLVESKKRRVPGTAVQYNSGASPHPGQAGTVAPMPQQGQHGQVLTRPAFDAPPPPITQQRSGSHGVQQAVSHLLLQGQSGGGGSQAGHTNSHQLIAGTASNAASRAKSTSPTVQGHGQYPSSAYGAQQTPQQVQFQVPHQESSGNPAYRGQQQPKRRDRDGKGHRRHHTVGTPGEFPVDEEDAASIPPPPSPHQHGYQSPSAAYGVPIHGVGYGSAHLNANNGVHGSGSAHSPASTQGYLSSSPARSPSPIVVPTISMGSPRTSGSQSTSPPISRTKSPRKSSRGEDEESTSAEEHLSALTITTASPASGSSVPTSSSGGKKGKHMRMLSNPPPIDEEDESLYYPPQSPLNAMSSSPISAQSSLGSSGSSVSANDRPARPTGGLQPRSATMRTEKTRHKDHSRPVTSKKKGHARRPSFDPLNDEADSVTVAHATASSAKELKRSSDKKMGANNHSGTSSATSSAGTMSTATSSAATNPNSPRGRKGSKGATSNVSSSPPLSDEDAHVITLNPSTPPHSPTIRSGLATGEPMVDLKASSGSPAAVVLTNSNGATISAPGTPLKQAIVKKESRSLVTRVKGFFSRKSGPEPRQVRFSINENNTTHEPPELVLTRIVEALKALDLPNHHFVSPFCIKTETDSGVVLEVEICQLPIIHLIGVRFRRICGDAWQYTRVCKRILDLLDLNNASKSASSPSTGTANANARSSAASTSVASSSASNNINPNLTSHSALSASPHASSSSTNELGLGLGAQSLSPSSLAPNGIGSDHSAPSSSASSSSSSKKSKRLSGGNGSVEKKKSKQHLNVSDDNGVVSTLSPKKRHTHDTDTSFNTSKYKDDSPKKAKPSKNPSLHPTQWEEDDESSSGALVS